MKAQTDSTAPLNVALIGCGKMAVHHAKAIKACGGGRIVGLADPSGDRSKLDGLVPRDVPFFTSAADLLKTVKPTVAHIITPPATHADLALLCLEHGSHVYVEKPFTLRLSEANTVLEAAQKTGRLVCAGHQLLYEHPARALLDSLPLIGRVVHVESYFSFKTVRKSSDGRSLMSPIEQLMDILPHPVYTLLHVLRGQCETVPILQSLLVRPEGEVHAIVQAGETTGVLVVTLRGRPVDSYLKVVGTNGSLRADFVRGHLTKLAGPGASAVGILSNPYREAMQIVFGSTKGFASRMLNKHKGYPGLAELIEAFYTGIRRGEASPLSPDSIRETVRLCEQIGERLHAAKAEFEARAEIELAARASQLPPVDERKGLVLVTGGSGLLGRAVVSELRRRGWAVRSLGRRIPPPSEREAGVEYVKADLGGEIDREILRGVETIVHCAAETAGGKDAHERNSVAATRNLLQAAADASVRRFIHISSLAVLKTSKEMGKPLDEQTPVDIGNLGRGPYVWGKAESERLVNELGRTLGLSVKIIRPGPLVDFTNYEPPGRLGRELGPIYVAVGPKSSRIALCDVRTAAQVIRATVQDFDAAPPVLNLVEPTAPTREELLKRWLQKRPDLKAVWLPGFVLSFLSPVLILLQRLLIRGKTPVDIAAAFASERYDTTLAKEMVRRAYETI
ncbi:MAG: Gfo/Idh/MocA family oxidoreductase [Nitrospira sp.]|nr:Gfo/Idh/MocA family oxidoreductase [Nitrospira sp.]MCP9462683.1 Gfo/Idh/MocA family oxidoreductase [Nitrospira sp.]